MRECASSLSALVSVCHDCVGWWSNPRCCGEIGIPPEELHPDCSCLVRVFPACGRPHEVGVALLGAVQAGPCHLVVLACGVG